MKSITARFLFILALFGIPVAVGGCVAEVGPGYYGGGPWYHDGPWMDGHSWGGPRGGVNVDIHPPGFRR